MMNGRSSENSQYHFLLHGLQNKFHLAKQFIYLDEIVSYMEIDFKYLSTPSKFLVFAMSLCLVLLA